MHFLTYISLVGFLLIAFREGVFASDQTSYDELKELNVSCYPTDSCKENRSYDSPDIFYQRCSCHSECSEFGTCCIDSPFRKHSPPVKYCRSNEVPVSLLGKSWYYMVQKCPNDSDNNMMWKSLCEREWNGDDDFMIIAPVISLDTKTTYKNYYCFRCHETTTNFLYWNLQLLGQYRGSDPFEQNDLPITYDRTTETWMVVMANNSDSFPVILKFEIPRGNEDSLIKCKPRIISDCSASWTDKRVQDKCNSYTALLYKKSTYHNIIYKNAHCALCNFVSLELLQCYPFRVSIIRKIFSFARLIDVNRHKVGKVNSCEANQVWDPFRLRCSKLVCAIPSYVVTDGKCSPP